MVLDNFVNIGQLAFMTKPTLYVFAISHYCEKARWGLDHLGVDYQVQNIAPGAHVKKAQSYGLKRGSLPYLIADETAIQGSSHIIDWAEAQSRKSITDDTVREIEKRLDDVIGVHIRRQYYSEAMIDQPETVRPIFAKGLPLKEKLMVKAGWKKITALMVKGMDLGPAQGAESKVIVEGELDWLDSLLADGRPYLAGEEFSRADLTVAALLAPLVNPPNHPTYADLTLPPGIEAAKKAWSARPVVAHIDRMYKNFR